VPPEDDARKTRFPTIRGPLGIIGLFIVLIYGMAVVFATAGLWRASPVPLDPLIWFLVLFPVLVLGVFTWLVVRHTDKLYSPGEYGEHKPSWMKTDRTEHGAPVPKKNRAPRPRKPKPKTEPTDHPDEAKP